MNAPEVPQPGSEVPQLPAALAEKITAAGKRPREPQLRALILELCDWRPLTARELAVYLGDRDAKNLRKANLKQLLASGQLGYVLPEVPHHPNQKYVTLEEGSE